MRVAPTNYDSIGTDGSKCAFGRLDLLNVKELILHSTAITTFLSINRPELVSRWKYATKIKLGRRMLPIRNCHITSSRWTTSTHLFNCCWYFNPLSPDQSTNQPAAWARISPRNHRAISFERGKGAPKACCLDPEHVRQLWSHRAAIAPCISHTPADDTTVRTHGCERSSKGVSGSLNLCHIFQPQDVSEIK